MNEIISYTAIGKEHVVLRHSVLYFSFCLRHYVLFFSSDIQIFTIKWQNLQRLVLLNGYLKLYQNKCSPSGNRTQIHRIRSTEPLWPIYMYKIYSQKIKTKFKCLFFFIFYRYNLNWPPIKEILISKKL